MAKKEGQQLVMGKPPVLPPVQDDKQRLQRKLDRVHAEQLMEVMDADEKKFKSVFPDRPYGQPPQSARSHIDEQQVKRMNSLAQKWANIADPELLKLSIKAQLKALNQNDFKSFDKI
jgi:hypothetical protein